MTCVVPCCHLSSLYILSTTVHTVNIEIRECVKWSLTKEVKKNRKSLSFQNQKVVTVAYISWSFTKASNCKALTGNILVFWIDGQLWEVVTYERWVAHRGLTV